jgi:hypothetical protein
MPLALCCALQLAWIRRLVEEVHSYSVNYHRAKDGRRHSLAVFRVLGRAHDDMVAAGKHAADSAEDYDGEDGDDDAVGWEVG